MTLKSGFSQCGLRKPGSPFRETKIRNIFITTSRYGMSFSLSSFHIVQWTFPEHTTYDAQQVEYRSRHEDLAVFLLSQTLKGFAKI